MMKLAICSTILAASALAAAFAAQPLASTQEVKPEQFLPAESAVMMQADGSAEHLEGLKKTVAWKVFHESGLYDRVLDTLETFVSTQSPEMSKLARESIEEFAENGISLGITATADGRPAPLAVLVLHDGQELAESLESAVKNANPRMADQVQTRSVEGREVSAVPIQPGIEITWWKESGHAIIAVGVQPAERVAAIVEGKSPNVTTHRLWKSVRDSSHFTASSCGWIDTKVLLDSFGDMPFPQPPPGKQLSIREFCDMLGVAELEAMTFSGGYKGTSTWESANVIAGGPHKGLLKMLDQRAISLDELPPLPADTDSFVAMSFDIKAAVDAVIETMEKLISFAGDRERAQYDKQFAQFQQQIGGHPRDVFSAGLGDLMCVYNDPKSMSFFSGLGPVFVANVKDRYAVEASLRRLNSVIQEVGRGEVRVDEKHKDGVTRYQFNIAEVPVTPSVLVTDKWVVVSLMPNGTQAFAARLAGRIPSWKPDDEFTAAMKELPETFSSIQYSNPAPALETGMSLAPMGIALLENQVLPQMARDGGPARLPFGVEDLPTAEELTMHVYPNVSVSTVTDNGVEVHSRQSTPSLPISNASGAAAVPVLVALLLPAVQQAREAARRTQSKNNLRQIGLAMHNYHDVYRSFPMGTVEGSGENPDERLGWAVSILPFMEQMRLYEAIDQESGWNADANKFASDISIPSFHNPSYVMESPSQFDYVAIAGVGKDAASLPIGDKNAGIFGYDRKTRMRDITDGTSNTMAVADSAVEGRSWMKGGASTIRGLSQQPYINGPDGIGGPHTGGVQVLFADGSVRFISENIDPQVFEALATMHGGEVVNAGF